MAKAGGGTAEINNSKYNKMPSQVLKILYDTRRQFPIHTGTAMFLVRIHQCDLSDSHAHVPVDDICVALPPDPI